MSSPARLVQPIHFDDYDGKQFERLVFAYHIRSETWLSLEWYGQTGSDLGRDIWGRRIREGAKDESICIQCANRIKGSITKAMQDIDKLITSRNGIPDVFRIVCTSNVSAKFRDKVKGHARAKGIADCDVWSGMEFEERLHSSNCESLLARFVGGVPFPESSAELRVFSQETQPPCNLPHPPSQHFVPAGHAWKKLRDFLAARDKTSRRLVGVLHGLHGTGKTHAACALAWEKRSQFSAVLWVRGDTKEILRGSLGNLCNLEALDLPQQKQQDADQRIDAVRRWLKQHSGWLLIVDNVETAEACDALFEWVPATFSGTLLITSCLSVWPPICTRIEVGSWDRSLSTKFLIKRLRLTSAEESNAAIVGDLLGGLPLALEQAAAYVEQTHMEVGSYVQRLRLDLQRELKRRVPGSTDYPASFAAVVQQSIQRLAPEATFLLELASFLSPSQQFLRIYEIVAARSSPEYLRNFSLHCSISDPEERLAELNRWSLVSRWGDNFDVHLLVQAVVRDSLSAAERNERLNMLMRLFFTPFAASASPNNSSYWQPWREVFPHMETFALHVRKDGDHRALGHLLNSMGVFLDSQGLKQAAVTLLREALQAAEKTVGGNHADTAAALSNLAETLRSTGRASEAKALLVKAVAIVRKITLLVPHGESSCWNNVVCAMLS